jgi:hypothetical protein
MSFRKTSRKNDLESLMYLMLYLLNGSDMPGLCEDNENLDDESLDTYQIFKLVKKLKENTSISKMS